MTSKPSRRRWLALFVLAGGVALLLFAIVGRSSQDDRDASAARSPASMCVRLESLMDDRVPTPQIMDVITAAVSKPGNVHLMTEVAEQCPAVSQRILTYHHEP